MKGTPLGDSCWKWESLGKKIPFIPRSYFFFSLPLFFFGEACERTLGNDEGKVLEGYGDELFSTLPFVYLFLWTDRSAGVQLCGVARNDANE